MLLILDKDQQITASEQVDQYVSARIPALPKRDDQTPEGNQQRRLWYYVTSLMMHDCGKACKGEGPDGRVKKCNKYFPKPLSDFSEHSGLFFKSVFN